MPAAPDLSHKSCASAWSLERLCHPQAPSPTVCISGALGLTRRVGVGGVVGFVARLQFTPLLAEARQVYQTQPLQSKLQGRRQDAETVLHTAAKVDG